jgi:hypothetical protein
MIITILRKPLEGSVAENTLKHGCGALNIDATRVPTSDPNYFSNWDRVQSKNQGIASTGLKEADLSDYVSEKGRWPANLVLISDTHTDEVPKDIFMRLSRESQK